MQLDSCHSDSLSKSCSLCSTLTTPLVFLFFDIPPFLFPLPLLPTENSQDLGSGVPEQFTGLLHGSSPVFDCREEPFKVPGATTSYSARGREVDSEAVDRDEDVPPHPPPPPAAAAAAAAAAMSAILSDCDPKAIYATVNKDPSGAGASASASSTPRMRPPGDLKLARSLSKSDSDLLVSPPSEEEGGLGNRSESVSNCSTSKRRLEKSPSFTSEWDEVSTFAACHWPVMLT